MFNSKRKLSLLGLIAAMMLILSACGNSTINLTHVHGLGYSSDGKQILIPAHDGLMSYSDGGWKSVEGPKHDYMGFSVVDDGFYSSGHPAEGSDLKDPLGIVKSTDQGKILEILDLHGEVDFHAMGVGYKNHTIYVINHDPNTKMKSAGLYYSLDETKTWSKSEMNGLKGNPISLAVHPTESSYIAISTQDGLYVSTNYGQDFTELLPGKQVSSVTFTKTGELYVGGYDKEAFLYRLNLETNQQVEMTLPPLEKDAVAYLAENPLDEAEIAFATFKKDVFLSKDKGENWEKIADQGKGSSRD